MLYQIQSFLKIILCFTGETDNKVGCNRNIRANFPQPVDFFRAIEESTGEDLSWFWRGWFYTTHANDQGVARVSTQSADSLLGTTERGANYYRVEVVNEGGLVMPLELEITYDDGSSERMRMPVDIWRYNEKSFTSHLNQRPLAAEQRYHEIVKRP